MNENVKKHRDQLDSRPHYCSHAYEDFFVFFKNLEGRIIADDSTLVPADGVRDSFQPFLPELILDLVEHLLQVGFHVDQCPFLIVVEIDVRVNQRHVIIIR